MVMLPCTYIVQLSVQLSFIIKIIAINDSSSNFLFKFCYDFKIKLFSFIVQEQRKN